MKRYCVRGHEADRGPLPDGLTISLRPGDDAPFLQPIVVCAKCLWEALAPMHMLEAGPCPYTWTDGTPCAFARGHLDDHRCACHPVPEGPTVYKVHTP